MANTQFYLNSLLYLENSDSKILKFTLNLYLCTINIKKKKIFVITKLYNFK